MPYASVFYRGVTRDLGEEGDCPRPTVYELRPARTVRAIGRTSHHDHHNDHRERMTDPPHQRHHQCRSVGPIGCARRRTHRHQRSRTSEPEVGSAHQNTHIRLGGRGRRRLRRQRQATEWLGRRCWVWSLGIGGQRAASPRRMRMAHSIRKEDNKIAADER